jgi:hypothetical protein
MFLHSLDEASEEILQKYDEELCRLRNWYRDKQTTYKKIAQWQQYWQEFLELEVISWFVEQ